MNDDDLQKLIEASLKDSSHTIRSNNDALLYESLFNELNREEELPIPFQFSNKVTRKAMEKQVVKEQFFTKVKIALITISSLLIAAIIFKVFKINIDFITTLPLSYLLYGLGTIITYILIEIADYLFLKKEI